MSNPQKPILKIGTKLKDGAVIRILSGKIEVLGEAGVQSLTFATVEKEVL